MNCLCHETMSRYDDWEAMIRKGDIRSSFYPVFFQFHRPSGSDWEGFLKKFRDFFKILETSLKNNHPELAQNGVGATLLSAQMLPLIRRVLKTAAPNEPNLGTQPVTKLLGTEKKIRDSANALRENFKEIPDYFLLAQTYIIGDVLYYTGRESLEELGEIVFVGQPLKKASITDQFDKSTASTLENRGRKVMIGIIDGAMPIAHERLRQTVSGGNAGSATEYKSLIDRIWLQRAGEVVFDDTFGASNGLTLSGDTITAWLNDMGPDIDEWSFYRKLRTGVDTDVQTTLIDVRNGRYQPLMRNANHGMHVIGTALDAFKKEGGELQDASICLVEVPFEVTNDTSGTLLGSYFIQAVRQLMLWADEAELPLVINFSYGMTAGPKDGSHPVEKVLKQLVDARTKYWKDKDSVIGTKIARTEIILPAGNSREERMALRCRIPSKVDGNDGKRTATWMVLPDDKTSSFVEIWIEKNNTNEDHRILVQPPGKLPIIELRSGGSSDGPTAKKRKNVQNGVVSVGDENSGLAEYRKNGQTIAAVYYDRTGLYRQFGEGSQESYFLAIAPTQNLNDGIDEKNESAPAGRWEITVANGGTSPIDIEIYAQRDDTPFGFPTSGRQSFFEIETTGSPTPGGFNKDYGSFFYGSFSGRESPGIATAANGNAIATNPIVTSVGALMHVTATEGFGEKPQVVNAPYSADVLRTDGSAAPNNLAVVDRSYANWGLKGEGTVTGSKAILSGTSIAAPQVAGKIAARIANG